MRAEIPRIKLDEVEPRAAELLEEAGCVVVADVISAAQREALRSELAGLMAATPVNEDDPEAFYPGLTRRVTSLVAHSETTRNFVMHPMCKVVCDHFLLPNCSPGGHYQLHVTAALDIGPGARKQVLHREEDPFPFFPVPRPNLVVATMWAISDFTADNGGTLLVPGSHRWEAGREAEPDEICAAEMPAGSVLFWMGGTLHGGGANVSDQWRYGVVLTYSLGWLRQEENQSLAVPLEMAETFPRDLQEMLGNTVNASLGFHFYSRAAAADPV
jgi:ectoine hydroxylase-related dioxygenase (phytanoyl-CoA dioxygenase family)